MSEKANRTLKMPSKPNNTSIFGNKCQNLTQNLLNTVLLRYLATHNDIGRNKMLVEFTVKNYRSIRDEQTLSMVSGKGSELSHNTFDAKTYGGTLPLVHSTAIYGANAAGKSNVIAALKEMADIVCDSASGQEGDQLNLDPFLFDDLTQSEPCEFEVTFIQSEVKYQYGFTADCDRVFDEWLIAYPKGKPQRWFEREYDPEEDKSYFKFSSLLSGNKTTWQNATRENALFFSTAVQLNAEQLKPAFNWFREKLRVSPSVAGWSTGVTTSLCDDDEKKEKVVSFLKAADLNIHDIQIDREEFNVNNLPGTTKLSTVIRDEIASTLSGHMLTYVKTIHKTKSGKDVALDIEDESDGTRKIFSLTGPIIKTLEHGYVLVIDELHDALHPKLVEHLVKMFHNKELNKKNAQLIFSTHETSILDQSVFRRDQVWFCEKDEDQTTQLYSLSDFSVRPNRDNIELGYLSGRYGALPFVTNYKL